LVPDSVDPKKKEEENSWMQSRQAQDRSIHFCGDMACVMCCV